MQMSHVRDTIYQKLHEVYAVRAFDNQDVWAGNLSVELDGLRFGPAMARAFMGADRRVVEAKVRAELYMRDIDPISVRPGDIDAHLWTDVNDYGFVDERGVYHNALGRNLAMHLALQPNGRPMLLGHNLVFESDVIRIDRTGVFHYTVEFSADDRRSFDPSKAWISINDIAHNQDGVIVISPERVRQCPSVTEVCVRKQGARFSEGRFVSGTFRDVTRSLETTPTDVVYLLPFFEPGYSDSFTGEDVRKGTLGSVYAVRDFFRIDPSLVSPPEHIDVLKLVSEGLIRHYDLHDLLDGRQLSRIRRVDDFNNFQTQEELIDWVGRDRLVQIVGRAELRGLARRAHELDKQVIFDLVLMQTSRDSPLIDQHPEWYVRDETGRPSIHQIAWLVYSDVALLDLPFNKPLQNYLSGVASFWIKTCDLDGVRIDASQTVDRPFLKKIKNRINQVKPDAIVLGETLCDLQEAVDVPVDMVYALLVDFHRDAAHATPYIQFLEHTFGTFAPRTVAMAYFENHDSPRATHIWRERFSGLLGERKDVKQRWRERVGNADAGLVMALLRNIQASLIDATAGLASGVNLAYGVEMGSIWGEEAPTDFENETLLHPDLAQRPPNANLARAYEALHGLRGGLQELVHGGIFFHRNEFQGGDAEDRVLAYTRYTRESGLLVVHNLDAEQVRRVRYRLRDLPGMDVARVALQPLFDTYAFFSPGAADPQVAVADDEVSVEIEPLQSVMMRVNFVRAE